MRKLVIVDDNVKIANNMCTILDWNSLGIEVSGSFTNPKTALEQIKVIKPDIVITDVVMPGMDGLELAKELKVRFPSIKIIFMSCYDEFDYVKSAMYLDGEAYILKPIVKEDILKALGKAINKHDSEEKQRMEKNLLQKEREEMRKELDRMLPLYQGEFLRELIFGGINDNSEVIKRAEYVKVDLSKKNIYVVAVELKENEVRNGSVEIDDAYFTVYTFKRIVSGFQTAKIAVHLVQLSKDRYGLLVQFDDLDENEENDPIVEILSKIKDEIVQRFKSTITFGVSQKSIGFKEIHKLYKQSVYALESMFYSVDYQIIFYEDIYKIQEKLFEEKVNLQLLYKEIEEIVSLGSETDIHKLIEKYFVSELGIYPESYVKSLVFSIVNHLQIILMKLNKSFEDIVGNEKAVWDKIQKYQTINDVRQWTFNLIKAVREYFCGKDSSQNDKLVNDIKNIITSRYSEQITINEMLQEIYISPGHANVIFKKATGKTIFDYLTDYRMEMAKKLLSDQYSKIYVVSKEVGYSNKSHFCLLFKKYTGLTPSEFKEKAVRF